MKKDQYIYLSRKAIFAAIISSIFPITVNAAAGKVEFAYGGAAVQGSDGGSKVLAKGMDINAGDTISTGPGRAQIKFTDGSYMSFQPNTQFKVEDYNFNGKQDGTEKGFFKLIEGGLRAITGLVGRENRSNYRLATPVATIGIRGTEFLAEFREKLKTHVGQGSIFVFNDQGDLVLFAGQSAEVGAGAAPKYSDEQLTLGARGPDGSTPQEVKTEEQAETAFNEVYQLPEEYNEDGISGGLGNLGGGISAVIANLNGINAEGTYIWDGNIATNIGSVPGIAVDSSTLLFAEFGNYKMYGQFNIKTNDFCNPVDYFAVQGAGPDGIGILPNGSIGLSGSGGNGGTCYGSCTIAINGLFSGAAAEKADVGYVVKQGAAIQYSGSAGIVSADIPNSIVPVAPRPGAIIDYYD